jgi:mannose-6-phosphate isomerase-like protein (cupin superfamily)
MKANCNIQSFSFAKSILHADSGGSASLLEPPFVKAELGRLDGRILATFPIASPADAHSDMWEMHPSGDEVLFMLTGELAVDYSDGLHSGTASVEAGQGIVVPRGVWHRLILREPGLLLALTPAQGTEARPDAKGQP